MVRGIMPGMEAGAILGHEGVGVIEAVGSSVRDYMFGTER
jgi:D-arabinose 1-dehydrogenase-like Zn-dependent alcohol dehydrogenase